jgi:parallel beta-helix repeat protein
LRFIFPLEIKGFDKRIFFLVFALTIKSSLQINTAMQRISIITLIILLIWLSIAGDARTYIVDDSGFANYATIQEAVIAASDGDTIYLKPGIYKEEVVLNKSLTILPLNGENDPIIVDGGGDLETGITIASDGCSLQGLMVRDYLGPAIYVQSNGNLINENMIEKANPGLLVRSSSDNTIAGNMIKDSQGAIAIWENSRYNQIENNRIEGCIVSILVSEASQNRISANQIKGGDIGLGLSNSTRNSILDNSIEGSANGLFVRDCIEDDLNNNSIFGSEYGMRMENLSFGTVNGNKIARSRNGIYFANCIKNNVSENSLNEIADTALQAALSNENKFTSNLISDSSMGIILVDDSLNSLSQNRLLNVSRCLYVESSDRVGFDNSIDESNVADSAPLVYLFNRSREMIEGREMAHLTLAYCENLTIKNSSITKDALFLYASRNNSIIGNNISSCYGMRLWGCNGNEISGNRLLENKFSGMFLYDSNSNEISGNNASLNSQMGISLLSCSGNTIRDNEVIANLASGIWLNLSDENLIRQNNISSNAVGLTVMTSIGNRIYHNNFLNNQEQSEDIGGSNSWDQGNMTGGNFWNDHVAKGNPSEKWPRMIKGGKMSDSYPFQDESGWLLAKASSP